MVFVKGNNYGALSKRNHTALSEKMKAAFITGASNVWSKLMKAQFKDAMINYKASQYVIDQVIGRPKETLEVEGGMMMQIDKAIIMQIGKIYGKKEGNGKYIGNGV